MINSVKKLKLAAVISLITLLPFMVMEFIKRRGFQEPFPVALFTILWLTLLSFIFILLPIVQDVRKGNLNKSPFANLLLRVFFLILIAIFWIGIIIDQMPCFLGIQNCD
jgi:RsiW-degrading membrane proteinase PrsW (M82 family)